MDRLLDLTTAADELSYLSTLERSGPPAVREEQGRTVQRARGQWLTHAAEASEAQTWTKEQRAARADTGATMAICAWRSAMGYDLSEEEGWKFRYASPCPGPH